MADRSKTNEDSSGRSTKRKPREYYQGEIAFNSRATIDTNPYTSETADSKRTKWYSGYISARTRFRLKHIFEKYGEIE